MSLAAPPSRPTPRPRVSRHRYRVRRLGVLTVLVAVGAGAAKVVSPRSATTAVPSLTGSGVADGTLRPTPPPPRRPMDSRPRLAEATTPPTEPPPEDTGPPTAANPAVVLIAGDSDAGTFAPYLDRLLADTDLVDTALDYKVSSGLARPDYFDWNARLHEHVPVVDPDIVVITFGGNDAQGLLDAAGGVVAFQPVPDSDNAEWRAEYGKRVGEVMDFLVAGWPHRHLGRHPQRRRPRRHVPHAGAGRDGQGGGGEATRDRVHRHLDALFGSNGRMGRVRHRSP